MTKVRLLLCCCALISSACHPGPVLNTGPAEPSVGGTIAGLVTTSDPKTPVVDRKITVTELKTGTKLETTIAGNGGYTIKVPEGTYHLEVELRPGESLSERPDDTHVNNGDLDAQRNFVITVRP